MADDRSRDSYSSRYDSDGSYNRRRVNAYDDDRAYDSHGSGSRGGRSRSAGSSSRQAGRSSSRSAGSSSRNRSRTTSSAARGTTRSTSRGDSRSAARNTTRSTSRSTTGYRTVRPSTPSRGYSYAQPSRPGLDPRLILLAAIAVVLIIVIIFTISRCVGQRDYEAQTGAASGAQTTQQQSGEATQPSTDSADASASQEAASSEQAAAEGSQQAALSTASAEAAPAREIIAAEPGDISYVVAQAAKLKYRDADFAVDPNRRDWNFDKSNGHKTIYLTFDDGPSANTEKALDILDQYGCKATFFVTGQNPEYFPMIKEAYDRGHTIGLHSMTHEYELIYSSSDAFWEDYDALGQVVKEQIGYVPCFIRFPGGSSNTISDFNPGIMTTLAAEAQERGYQYWDWWLSCGDGSVLTTEETIMYGCEETDMENAIYLLHDGAGKETTIEALPSIIEYYQAQGYTFEALDRSSIVAHHEINN